LVQALRYKPEFRGFDSRWAHGNFSLISGLTMAVGSILLLTFVSTRDISWWWGVKAAGA
jgi:hypothetical protein